MHRENAYIWYYRLLNLIKGCCVEIIRKILDPKWPRCMSKTTFPKLSFCNAVFKKPKKQFFLAHFPMHYSCCFKILLWNSIISAFLILITAHCKICFVSDEGIFPKCINRRSVFIQRVQSRLTNVQVQIEVH